jgi:hypothetical protein
LAQYFKIRTQGNKEESEKEGRKEENEYKQEEEKEGMKYGKK